jgi:hypothetical protein
MIRPYRIELSLMLNLSWENLYLAFTGQQHFCRNYSPLYEAIFAHAAGIIDKYESNESLEFDEQAFFDILETEWANRTLQTGIEATLLLAGGIHAAVLNDDPEAEGISRFFATVGGSYQPEYDRDVLYQMLGGLYLHAPEKLRWFLREGHVQTNEVSRGIVWLLPALILSAVSPNLPITLVDLGCSAGLNLAASVYTWHWTSSTGNVYTLGASAPTIGQALDLSQAQNIETLLSIGDQQSPRIVKYIGFDLQPMRLDIPDDLLALRACIWGDQPERLTRFDQAVEAFQTTTPPPEVVQADIKDVARTLHESIGPETRLLLVYNTAVTLYLNDEDYALLGSNIAESFRQLPSDVRGLWIELESRRRTDPPTPAKLYPIKIHRLVNGELQQAYYGFTEPHPQHISLLAGWEHLLES